VLEFWRRIWVILTPNLFLLLLHHHTSLREKKEEKKGIKASEITKPKLYFS
jgi:hypothetical protein